MFSLKILKIPIKAKATINFPNNSSYIPSKGYPRLPSCADCIYSEQLHEPGKNDLSCKLFSNFLNGDNFHGFYVSTDSCRLNTAFCGSDGKYFKPIKPV